MALSSSGQPMMASVGRDWVNFFLAALLVFGWVSIGCWFDLTQRRLPNWWLALGAVGLTVAIGLVLLHKANEANQLVDVASAVCVGTGLWFGAYLMAFLLQPRSIGAGDVKLAAILGGSVGLVSGDAVATGIWIAVAILLAAGLTLLMTVVSVMRKVLGNRRKAITAPLSASEPHGPPMLAAAVVVWGIGGGYV